LSKCLLKSRLPTDPRSYDTGWRNSGYDTSLRGGFQLAWGQESKLQACTAIDGAVRLQPDVGIRMLLVLSRASRRPQLHQRHRLFQ
jgi:hypothetical protein